MTSTGAGGEAGSTANAGPHAPEDDAHAPALSPAGDNADPGATANAVPDDEATPQCAGHTHSCKGRSCATAQQPHKCLIVPNLRLRAARVLTRTRRRAQRTQLLPTFLSNAPPTNEQNDSAQGRPTCTSNPPERMDEAKRLDDPNPPTQVPI